MTGPGKTVRGFFRSSVVVVVGHQPTLGRVASRLLSGVEADWPMRKGGVWWFSSRDRDGVEQAVLRAVLSADLL